MMNAYVTYNAQYKVLICREHKYGIAPDYVLRHLRDYHKGVPLATRNAIVNYSKTLDLAVPENIIMPNLYSGLDCATVINSMPAFSISDPGGFKKRRRVMAVVDAE